MRWLLEKKYFKYGVIAAVIIVILLIVLLKVFGAGEITLLNSKSITDWKIGGTVIGITSPEEGEYADYKGFEWFSEDGKMGLRSDNGTCYYMSYYPANKFCVTGFVTSEKVYSILGIRVGDDELEAKNILLDMGFSVTAGGLNSVRAVKGCVTVELRFSHGSVTQVSAFIA